MSSQVQLDQAAIDGNWFGALKSSVRVLAGVPAEGFVYVGTARRGITLDHYELLPALKALDGSRSFRTLAEMSLIETPLLLEVVEQLLATDLLVIDHQPLSPQPETNELRSVSQNLFDLRMNPEVDLAEWRGANPADSKKRVISRSEFPITVLGRSRSALTLLSLLQASGFSETRIVPNSNPWAAESLTTADSLDSPPAIHGGDVCGLVTRISDVGASFSEFVQEVIRNARSSASQQQKPANANTRLLIATQPLLPDTLARCMSEGIPHIQISPLVESRIEISPLVRPGIAPCLRCVALHKYRRHPVTAQFELLGSLDPQPELPSAAVAIIAGIVCTMAIEFVDTGSSTFTNRSTVIDLHDPCNGEHIHWEPHSLCGCFGVV